MVPNYCMLQYDQHYRNSWTVRTLMMKNGYEKLELRICRLNLLSKVVATGNGWFLNRKEKKKKDQSLLDEGGSSSFLLSRWKTTGLSKTATFQMKELEQRFFIKSRCVRKSDLLVSCLKISCLQTFKKYTTTLNPVNASSVFTRTSFLPSFVVETESQKCLLIRRH